MVIDGDERTRLLEARPSAEDYLEAAVDGLGLMHR
jgi:hypothetical protein